MKKYNVTNFIILFLLLSGLTAAAETETTVAKPVEITRIGQEFSTARLEPALMDSKQGIAVIFEGTEGLHYYAKPETAPAAGFELKVEADSDDFGFDKAVFPRWSIFEDLTSNKVEVYSGHFIVFIPIITVRAPTKTTVIDKGDVEVKISGIACTSQACLPPFEKTLRITVDLSKRDVTTWKEITIDKDAGAISKTTQGPTYTISFALILAFLAGLSLNIMPCVWPVIPIIVMRLLNQAQKSKARSVGLGLAFCGGILLFFVAFAVVNIVLRAGFGTIFQWGDHFRNPDFLIAMALLMVVLAMFMFGIFNIAIPASVAGKGGNGQGYLGSVGMGFIAAILATPCSFAILTAAFAWAQTQPLLISTLAIMLIGIGMALPYAVLTSIPFLLQRLPKPGRWMEIFKQALGFILLFIAIKLIEALPGLQKTQTLFYSLILGFCVWMWGTWVSYNTSSVRRWTVRLIALVIAVAAGFWLLPQKHQLIDWQDYNPSLIKQAAADNRPVLLEFTADWCLSCKTIEKTVYNRRDITKLIKDKAVLAIRADTTLRDYPATIDLRDVYHEPAVPVSILIVPGEDEPIRFHGILIGEKLKEQLTKLPDRTE